MATLPSYFRDYLTSIRPTPEQRSEMKSGHELLRERLHGDEELAPILVSDFLQGSYRRATPIRPKAGKRSDVDIVVVTNLDSEIVAPKIAMALFEPFLDKHYQGKWEYNNRSFAIELSKVALDLVITAAPSEATQQAVQSLAARSSETPEDVTDWVYNDLWLPLDQRNKGGALGQLRLAADAPAWKSEPLLIPDREAENWQETDPLRQIEWTFQKNSATNTYYVNVVKSIKWWRREKHPTPKRPKGYPLEHIVGDCCPDGIESVAEGITTTFEEIRDRWACEAALGVTPSLPDRNPDLKESSDSDQAQNVLKRLDGKDFATFHGQCSTAAKQAREALEEEDIETSAKLWRELLGDEFPKPPESKNASSRGSGSAAISGISTSRAGRAIPPRDRVG